MINQCPECDRGHLKATLLPEHTLDLGGIVVSLKNAVRVYRCDECGREETETPDLRGLTRTVAVVRALIPQQLSGGDIRFMRKALDMSQTAFAEAMELTPETVSRLENDVRGAGGMTEKLVRHNVCALLHDKVPAVNYDPAMITRMRIQPAGSDELAPLLLERVVLKRTDHVREDAWDYLAQAA